MKKIILASALILADTFAYGYSKSQIDMMTLAAETGERINGQPVTMMAIVLQESSAGVYKRGDDGKSVGLAHVTEDAATDVIAYCNESKSIPGCDFVLSYKITNGLKHHLAADDNFNITVSAIYFKLQYDYFSFNGYEKPWTRAVAAYNMGRSNVLALSMDKIENCEYVGHIRRHIRDIKKAYHG